MWRKAAAALTAVYLFGASPVNADGFHLGISLKVPAFSVHFGVTRPVVVRRRACPPPRVYRSRRVWVPGRYVERVVYVTVPGRWEVRWVPAVVEHVYSCGVSTTVVVVPGHWQRVWIPPRRVAQRRLVYVPGHWR